MDFGQYIVIAVAMGARGSTGHDIKIVGVESAMGVLRVRVQLAVPGEACLVGGMFTQPADIVRVAKSRLLVTFVETVTETRC